MVSKARLDFPEPESPVMQMRAFRGSRTVMSLRLCSRAPWTTSSSAAMGAPLYLPNVCSYRDISRFRAILRTVAVRERELRLVAGAIAVSALGDWVAVLAL